MNGGAWQSGETSAHELSEENISNEINQYLFNQHGISSEEISPSK